MAQTEVRHGRFVYRDTLFVEVEGDRRHARASPTELKDLLLPKEPDATSSSRDQVGHFYQAQLVHYGLPFTRDKRGAKLRLIEAINSKTFHVPIDVRNIEANLKKQYTAQVRKLNSAVKRDKDSNTEGENRKRKASNYNTSSGQTSATKVSIKIGDVAIDVDHSSTLTDGGAKRHKRAASDEPERAKSVKKRSSQVARSSPLASSRVETSSSKTCSPGPALEDTENTSQNQSSKSSAGSQKPTNRNARYASPTILGL